MARVKSRDTAPEKLLRRALRKAGLRFRSCDTKLPGKPDFVLSARRLAIFVDGDFWHGRQWQTRKHASLEGQFTRSQSRDYWLAKIRRNMARDMANTAALLDKGWSVARLWETDVNRDPDQCLRLLSTRTTADSLSLLPHRTVAEFFAGIGLIRYAFERQGWRVAFANDIDAKKAEMYSDHFGDALLLGDVHHVDPATIPAVSIATASFPCTDLSLAGERKGLCGNHSSAFWGFLDVLGKMDRRPPLVLIENVPGFLTSRQGRDLHAALAGLNGLGYSVDLFTLDAVHFVPQSRNRLFLIGQPQGPLDGDRPPALQRFVAQHPDIQWTIRRLPQPPERTRQLVDVIDSEAEWWDADRSAYLFSQMIGVHREKADQAIRKRRWTYATVFRRVRERRTVAELRTDGIAGCLRTPRGGSARQILFKAGYGRYKCRLLSPRECARLMGADDYRIEVPNNQALFGFGDAVCVPAIEWIVTHYLMPLCNELIRGRVLIR
jgi:DNA (cytosine-5)-methyltransferase 1